MTSHDVLVIGAGLAGLAAASRLRDKGHQPLILEQSDGPGGRMRTDIVDGFRLDRGFQTLSTASPHAARMLDYDALDLCPFDSGALVRVGDTFHRVGDPFHSPGDALGTLMAPIGNLRDKRAILKFRNHVRKLEFDDVFTQKETTALARLEEYGFSSKMIDRFLRPLFAGITLDPDLQFSSRSLEFLLRMLSDGDTVVPALGMGEIPMQMANRLPEGSVRYGAEVTEVAAHHVIVGGDRIEAHAVIVATDATDACRLTGGEVEDPGMHSLTTWWFAAPESPVRRTSIVLDGNGDGAFNHLAVLSLVSPSYSPDDRALIAVSAPRIGVDEQLVRKGLADWFGPAVEEWEALRVDEIVRAQPKQAVGEDPDQSVRLASGLFVAGDHRQHASINGALTSGCRAADAVTARLCRDI